MKSMPAFSMRICPHCGSSKQTPLFELETEQFCSVNWTYSSNYRELLGIPEDVVFPIDRCLSCGFVYSRLLPSSDFLSCVYEKVISKEGCLEGSQNALSYARRMQYIATLLEMVTEEMDLKALDFGCGLGISLRLLSVAGIQTIGFDPSQLRSTYVKDAGCLLANNESDLKRYAPYDIVICDNVLEHVPEPHATVSLLASFCREGALLYVSVPSYEEEFILKQLDAIKNKLPVDMTLNPWEHLNYFDLRSLDKLMRYHRFIPVEASELAGHVDIGLRPEPLMVKRVKNSIASVSRLIGYAILGRTKRNVTNAFYRFVGHQS
jgi:SAM-dependent methyltransferase